MSSEEIFNIVIEKAEDKKYIKITNCLIKDNEDNSQKINLLEPDEVEFTSLLNWVFSFLWNLPNIDNISNMSISVAEPKEGEPVDDKILNKFKELFLKEIKLVAEEIAEKRKIIDTEKIKIPVS